MRRRIDTTLMNPVALVWQNQRVAQEWRKVVGPADREVMDHPDESTFFVDADPMRWKINNDPAAVGRHTMNIGHRTSG